MGLHLPKGLYGYYLGSRRAGNGVVGLFAEGGKHVSCFYDVNALGMGSIDGIDVMCPSPCVDDSAILLISPVRHAEEIILSVRELGYRNIVVGNILKFIPRYGGLEVDATFPPFGHFYSLYPDFYEIDERYSEIRSQSRAGDDGIDMNDESQQLMLKAMNRLYDSLPAWEKTLESRYRYRVGNPSIGLSDSVLLHFMIRLLKPRNFIEIGSGYSSAVTLDTNEFYMEKQMNIQFVEPYPSLVYSLMKETDDKAGLVIPSKLQDMPLEFFDRLEDGDVLFVDSTHVSKAGSWW